MSLLLMLMRFILTALGEKLFLHSTQDQWVICLKGQADQAISTVC